MKKTLLYAASLALATMPAAAQKLGEGYVTWPESSDFGSYVEQWTNNNGAITINGSTWEDANFFISRVKPKERFYNVSTQVYPGLTQYDESTGKGTDKRVEFWVPIGTEHRSGVKLNALPDGIFDGETFSMWSYIDNYGNWNAPFGFTPGVFADVAHKNGVGTHGVAGIPFGNYTTAWRNCISKMTTLGAEKVGKFLYYFGQDGLGYNSEWGSPGASSIGLVNFHNGLKTYMADRNPLWEVMWYAGVCDGGGNAFDTGISSFTGIFQGASLFLNYNWNSVSTMTSSIQIAKNNKKSPFYIYAGMNMQGGEPKSGSNYDLVKDYQYSIGLWGAHMVNMFWEGRYAKGSSESAKAAYYQEEIETWFGNGPRNPAIKLTPTLNRTHRPNSTWAGMSSMVSARSTLSWDLTKEPFYTFFNLGNGGFLNWKGERMNDNEWYNIGVQDYMPTWRFWFAPTWMGGRSTSLQASDQKMNAVFTWEDAYVGGSCLKVSGTADTEFLHLFKTNFTVDGSTKVRVTFKVLGGSSDVALCFNSTSAPGKNPGKTLPLINKADCEDLEDQSFNDGWITKEVSIGTRFTTMGVIALKFTNAENLELLLGGLEVSRNDNFATPAAPQITLSKVLAYNNSGVDAKLIWKMANSKASDEPCYNSDVNTSMFRMWAQQEGGEAVNMGLTTSWAGIIFAAPVDNSGTKKMRFGVSALSVDTKSESDITWTDYLTLPAYKTVDDITISKSIIKPGESFVLAFADPVHASATWTITDEAGATLWSASGVSVECPGLDGIGAYNLTVTSGSTSQEFPRYIAISSNAVGALPEIYSLAIDGTTTSSDASPVQIKVNDTKTLSYTGRPADGSSSRGIDLNENWFGVQCGEIGLGSYKSFSVAAWIKYNELPTGRSNFITVEDRINGGWPYDNWGFFWSRINDEGRFIYDGIDTGYGWRVGPGTEGRRMFYRYNDAKVDVGAWTHVAIVFEYNNSQQIRSHFYINGKKQMVSEWCSCLKSDFENKCGGVWSHLVTVAKKISGADYGENTYEPTFTSTTYPITDGMWISFGGSSQDISAVKGCVDDFQVWGKAMTDDDVKKSMEGLDKNNLPAEVLGYWDLEDEPASDYGFVGATGANATNKTPKAYWCEIPSEGEGKNTRIVGQPTYLVGCPFIAGTAYPVVTTPTWETRRANINGSGTGESGSATMDWVKAGDYSVKLHLANGHGEATMDYPVVKVTDETQGIGEIGVDNDGFITYTIEDALFVEFDADGAYSVEVYNMAGMLAAQKAIDVVAGQNVSIALGQPGVYLVKVTRDGQLLRTVKVIRK